MADVWSLNEIRLEIYPHLLSASHLWRSSHPTFNPGQPPCYTLRIDYPGPLPSPAKLHYQPQRSYGCTDEPFTPQILATCSQICSEASFLLYSTHTFSFLNDPTSSDIDVHDRLSYSATAHACQQLMTRYPTDDWHITAPNILQLSPLAAFLRNIVPANAALVQNLELHSRQTRVAANDVTLAAELCAAYLQVDETQGLWSGGVRRACHCSKCWQSWAKEQSGSVYKALQGFVGKVEWLEGLQYRYLGPWDTEEWDTRGKICELQEAVEDRAREAGWDEMGSLQTEEEEQVGVDSSQRWTVNAAVAVAVPPPPPPPTKADMQEWCSRWDSDSD
ncbi:MAG: hypothetical protein Q9185_005168 [Variospora sp. 1 TL-2023]